MSDKVLKVLLSPMFYIPVITLIVMFIVIQIANKGLKKLLVENATKIESKKRNTIVTLATNITKYIVIIFGLLIILSAWGVNVSGIITGLGVAGVVAGLALQDALKDIIMGCNIIMDNFYVVGDYVSYGDFTGEVIEFGLKNTKIKDSLNHVLVLANRNVDKVINYSQGKFMIPLTISVSYEEKHDKVVKVIEKIVEEAKTVSKVQDVKYVGLQKMASSSVDYKLIAFCNPADQYQVERDINEIIKITLDDNNIKIPYTQLEVHNGK